mmetsp:Transcript_17580/g.23741  ORF Transcript_17580/g.23741 Transcript_17580/m.23741 type:complete len:121 (-) Transcript_17580:1652-2014(-)
MPTQVISSEKAVQQIKQQRGQTVARSAGKKISPLDNVHRDPTDRWSMEDTQKFYAALSLMGTDFGLIATLFQGQRTRNQIKNKFNKEQRSDMAKVNRLLEQRIDLETFERENGSLPPEIA